MSVAMCEDPACPLYELAYKTVLRLELPLQGFLERFGNIANASSGGGQV